MLDDVEEQLKLTHTTNGRKRMIGLDHVKRDPMKRLRGLLLALGVKNQYRTLDEFDTPRVRSCLGLPHKGLLLRQLIHGELQPEI